MFSNPQSNVDKFGLMPGLAIADIGSGTGEYSFAIARAVGNEGKVYAVDVQKDLLTHLKQLADAEGLGNIEILWANAEKPRGTGIADRSLAGVVLANVLFQIEEKEGFAKEVARILRSKGRIFIIDWKESFGGLGPQSSNIVSPSDAEALFVPHGCVKITEFDAGDNHYGLILEKNI